MSRARPRIPELALRAWDEKGAGLLEARARADAYLRGRERTIFESLVRQVLGVVLPPGREPSGSVDGLALCVGRDASGAYVLRVALGCPRCGRPYGDWGFKSLEELGEILSGEQEHLCPGGPGGAIVAREPQVVRGPRWAPEGE